MAISIEDIKKLKELSGIGLTDAKAALTEANGDFDKALAALRQKGLTKAEKKSDREAREGLIDGYVHGSRIGVVVEVNCETEFVARTDGFKEFAHNISLQIASMSPTYIREEDVPAEEVERVKSEAKARAAEEGKPEAVAEKMAEGSLKKYYEEKVLLNQVYVMNDKQTVGEYLKENIAKTGENLIVRQFKRIELGVNE